MERLITLVFIVLLQRVQLCPCGLAYVGQTKRPLKQQISEHETAICTGNVDDAIANHYAH